MKTIKRNFVSVLEKRFSEKAPLIQILLGPRQVGKTTGVLQFLKEYKHTHVYASADNVMAHDKLWIQEQWQNAVLKSKKTLLVIDEIQKIENWAEVIKKLWDEQRRKKTTIKLLLLGSSSLSLSKGISESLAGRFELTHIFHWDFVESNKLKKMDLETYLEKGGYPKSYDYIGEQDRWEDYVKQGILDRVIDKDILQHTIPRGLVSY